MISVLQAIQALLMSLACSPEFQTAAKALRFLYHVTLSQHSMDFRCMSSKLAWPVIYDKQKS